MFGYMMPYGVFADGDPGLIPMGIYKDHDGDPETEGELYAWWDGTSSTCCYRWGIDRDRDPKGLIGPDEWGIVSDADLVDIAARELSNTTLAAPHYEIAYADDLGGLNVDTFIKITPAYDVATNPTFTVRLTGQSIADAGVAPDAPGTADGPWVATPAMAFADFPVAPVAGVLQFDPVIYSVEENDGNIVVTVERTEGTDGDVTVDYEIVNGTAIGGTDFVSDAGTLTFDDTVSSQTIQVEILNDSVAEADKNFTIVLSNVQGGATLSTVNIATITINDSDVEVPEVPVDGGGSSSGLFGLSWMTYGLLALGLLLRRRRL
jgi:hypothetical protein